jgi:DNA-binding transcriptional regulator YiaG
MKTRGQSLPEQLRAWRRRNKLSQVTGAMKLQVSPRTLQNWEQGHRAPQGFALRQLLEKIK